MRLQLVAQGRSHPGNEFIHAERFRDVIVGAKIKGLHLARLIAAARKHNYWDSLVAASYHSEQFVPLYIWKPEIKNDHVGRFSKQFESVFAVSCLYDLIAMRA